jgi:putative aldouronate transport system substrate-binding protein
MEVKLSAQLFYATRNSSNIHWGGLFMAKLSHVKGTTLGICLLVFIILVTACSGNSNNTQSAGTANNGEKPAVAPVVTVLLPVATNFQEDNAVLDKIRELSGVNLQVETVINDDYDNRLNTLIVSGKTPDFFMAKKAKIKELVENDVILALDELLASNGQNVLDNKGDYLKGPAYIEGKTYGIPETFFAGSVLALRKDWLDKLDLKVPTTMEEYENVLRSFVNDDPNGSGKKDTIGLGVAIQVDPSWEHIFAAYGVPQNRQLLIDGQIIPWMLTPGYLDAVKYLNKLYKEGLIDPEFATVPTLQSFEKLWNGQVGAYNFNADGITQNWLSRYVEDPKPEFVYTVIKGPDGKGGYLKPYREDSINYTVISSQAKNSKAVMDVLNVLVSEEGFNLTWAGVEGVQHQWVNGEFEWIEPYGDAVKLRDSGGFVYSVLMDRIDGLREQLFNDITREGRQLVLENSIEDAYIFDLPEIERERGTIMKDMEKEFRVLAIMSRGDLDALYADFKKKYLAEGGSAWIEQATEIYNKEQAALKE